jgi:hypothetical protein
MRWAWTGTLLVLMVVMSSGVAAQPFAGGGGGGAKMPERGKPFALDVTVSKKGEAGAEPVAGATVLLEARAGEMVVTKKSAVTGAGGVAKFETLQSIAGVTYVPTVTHDGATFSAVGVVPPKDGSRLTSSLSVYGISTDDSKIRVSQLITAAELWEDQFLITQTWTFVNRDTVAFDPTKAGGEKYNDGLQIRTPTDAKGVHATVIRGRGDVTQARVVEDKVWVRSPVPPETKGTEPLRVRLQFSLDHNTDTLSLDQPILYPVEYSEVIAPLGTRFEKVPTLDLSMNAPGHTVETRKLRNGDQGLVASGGKYSAGDGLRFDLSGFPVFTSPFNNIAAVLVLLIFVGGVLLFRKEVVTRRGGRSEMQQRTVALKSERETLFESLRDLELRYDQGGVSDRAYDIEAASLRERLALVLRRLAANDSATSGTAGQ